MNNRRKDLLPVALQELWDFNLNYQNVDSEQVQRYVYN